MSVKVSTAVNNNNSSSTREINNNRFVSFVIEFWMCFRCGILCV